MALSPDGNTIAAGYNASDGGGVSPFDLVAETRLTARLMQMKEGEALASLSAPTAIPSRQDMVPPMEAVLCCGTQRAPWGLARSL